MNEHLLERFRHSVDARKYGEQDAESAYAPPTLNERIRNYFEKRQPSDASNWVGRPEYPTAEEVLDTEGDEEGWGQDVELIPNKRKGAWQSKGI